MAACPLVSVVVPVFNGERYIGATLDSALMQTYRNLEIIVVDDGSRDGTRTIVESRAALDPRIRLIAQPNGGVAAARNRAIAASHGDFVAPLDADDLWEPTKIERQVQRMNEEGLGTGVVYSWWVWIDSDGAVLDVSPRWRIEGSCADALLEVNYIGCASIPLFRRHVLAELGGYDESMHEGCEDWDLSLRVAERARVAVVPAALVAYRRSRYSMSTDTRAMWRAHRRVIEHVRKRRAHVADHLVRRSEDQFALYVAGVSFWSGDYQRALRWGLRAVRSSTAFRILPYVVRRVAPMLWKRDRAGAGIVSPGIRFGEWPLPEPRIPYHRIYHRRFGACSSR